MSKYINVETRAKRDESNERLIARFIKKCKTEGIVREMLDRRYYVKESEKKNKKNRYKRYLIEQEGELS